MDDKLKWTQHITAVCSHFIWTVDICTSAISLLLRIVTQNSLTYNTPTPILGGGETALFMPMPILDI